MSFEIVTDSSCNLPEDIIDRYGLHILSLRFLVGGKEYYSYTKGEITDLAQFYTMMRNKEEITTSQISSDICTRLFESLLQDGKDVLYIGFSSALSGTYQVGYLALEELKKKYPERKIYAVDTLGASLGEGLLVYHAANLREYGKSIEEVNDWLLENRLHLCHWFTVDDLFFLQRGGRVSGTVAIFGTLLNVKPVMHMDNEGRLIFVTKVRGRKRSLDALVERLDQTAINPSEQSIFITHGDCLEDAQYVAKKIEEKYHPKEIVINWVDPVIGAHSGPGTVALFFLGTER
ncbi:EDD domain protein, DegV family [Eubacterium maltosivorans]|uniref:DegV family protein n=1 Tax=Eubacterium maltosivorans TaxID=2041044 RepID=UPI00088B1F08|nr:DegV family protein [Eubacterium maltosivorans]MBS6339845.1 DegV family protein [Eubacterium limosum]WPK78822.1 DegV domain-containing protein [Eubacterium maltosivorans]SDP73834.1 EDD domain protein, DegV family [Eubacterium maltosivorans]